MSVSAPEVEEGPTLLPGASTEDSEFLVSIFAANANWSAGIHNAALDGQERASNEWAERYSRLARRLEMLLLTAGKWDRDTELFEELAILCDAQSFWPGHAEEQVECYRERIEKEKAERDGIPE